MAASGGSTIVHRPDNVAGVRHNLSDIDPFPIVSHDLDAWAAVDFHNQRIFHAWLETSRLDKAAVEGPVFSGNRNELAREQIEFFGRLSVRLVQNCKRFTGAVF